MVKTLAKSEDFDPELANAGNKLVVVDFFATWCGPCRTIAPFFAGLATKYPNVVFLKVDVDQCQDIATREGISAMPTFVFYKNSTKVDTQRGADSSALEEKVKKWRQGSGDDEEDDVPVKGHMDLNTFINKAGCECLNDADDHPLAHCLTTKGGYLESDCDEQLIIQIEFTQPVKLHSVRLYGPPDKAPKTVKIFKNQPRTLDFDSADSMEAIQILDLTSENVQEGSWVPLKYVKFQSVSNVTLFIKDNLGGGEITQLDYLGFIGTPVQATNMSEFKRVAGKKGEAH